MRINTTAGMLGYLNFIKDRVNGKASYDELQQLLETAMCFVQEDSWDDPDYYFDRKAKIVKKIGDKYIDKNLLTEE